MPKSASSALPGPHRCSTWNDSKSFGSASRTAALMACAPEEPPVTIRTGLPSVKPKVARPFRGRRSKSPANGRAGIDALFAKAARRFRESAEYLARKGRAELVGQPRRHIRFVQNHAHPVQPRAVDHGHGDEAALGKTTSGFSCFISFEA